MQQTSPKVLTTGGRKMEQRKERKYGVPGTELQKIIADPFDRTGTVVCDLAIHLRDVLAGVVETADILDTSGDQNLRILAKKLRELL